MAEILHKFKSNGYLSYEIHPAYSQSISVCPHAFIHPKRSSKKHQRVAQKSLMSLSPCGHGSRFLSAPRTLARFAANFGHRSDVFVDRFLGSNLAWKWCFKKVIWKAWCPGSQYEAFQIPGFHVSWLRSSLQMSMVFLASCLLPPSSFHVSSARSFRALELQIFCTPESWKVSCLH